MMTQRDGQCCAVQPGLLETRMLSRADAFPDTTPADQRHTKVVIKDHFSDINDDEREEKATSRTLAECAQSSLVVVKVGKLTQPPGRCEIFG